MALQSIFEEAIHTSTNTGVRANPLPTFCIESVTNEPDFASPAPNRPEGSFGCLFKSNITC
jgi:hypothetical protein